ncbi:methyltransferase [Novosphingobium sp. PC22D]|uniref:class I SAM-dependent methyltransferase n=1 Tax=Novosphingobium sp. PC22D TaxID=1962403 RepID=UPI000BF064C9|nr:class I SAM-dependent methyltransferase [Novosphingobium sp. PC22D]PEQ10822.1 methyltransferase [Novosphingobium sp. PC22D]
MRRLPALSITILLAVAGPSAFAGTVPPDSFVSALADPRRDEPARKLDDSRKPAEVLAYLGLEEGMRAADIMTGSGYWAEIMASVVGPEGKVTAFEPEQFYKSPEEQVKWKAIVAGWPEVEWVRYPFEAFSAAPGSFDFAIINLSYHDLYWESEKFGIPRSDPDAFVSALFAAMRPGGIVGIVDHVGLPGDTRAIVDKLHRIDPATVKRDFERAGFVLEDASELLANPEDDHTKLVFDPAVRFKTDRFVYRFRKPKG